MTTFLSMALNQISAGLGSPYRTRMSTGPSRHASGGSYTWLEGSGPDEIELAELPEVWSKRLEKSARGDTEIKLNDPPVNAVLEGRRNNHLTQLGGVLRRLGNSQSVILAALLAENAEKCIPPLDGPEVQSIADSIARYPSGLIMSLLVLLIRPLGYLASNTSSDIAYGIMDAFLDRHFEGRRTLLYSADGGFWRHDGRMWILVQEEWLKGRILAFLEEMPHNSGRRHASTMTEVLNLTRAKLATAEDVLRFRSDPPLVINCKNGELWITDDINFELRPHSPSSYLRHCLEIPYLPDAKCPVYDATRREIFGGSDDVAGMIRHWDELVGRTILPDRGDAWITLFYGRGANGKTRLFNIITQLLGPSLVHAGQLEEIDKNRFVLGNLLGKLVFVDDDVRAGARLPDGALKRLSERKLVTAEQKYRNPISFYCLVAPFLLCNNLPSIVDVSDGLFRRLMVIPFGRTFSPAEAKNSPFPEILENEMSGVLNRALEGYKRYRKRGHFKLPRDVKKATKDWVTTANPLKSFIAEECLEDLNSKWLLSDFYARYTQWAQEAGITRVLQRNTLKSNLIHLGFMVTHIHDGNAVIGLAPRRGLSST